MREKDKLCRNFNIQNKITKATAEMVVNVFNKTKDE